MTQVKNSMIPSSPDISEDAIRFRKVNLAKDDTACLDVSRKMAWGLHGGGIKHTFDPLTALISLDTQCLDDVKSDSQASTCI